MLKSSIRFALVALLVPGAALAAPAAEVPTARVSFAELNLATPLGRAALENRIRRAAQQLCIDNRVSELRRQAAGRTCYAGAMASALPQVERAIASAATGEHYAAAGQITLSSRR